MIVEYGKMSNLRVVLQKVGINLVLIVGSSSETSLKVEFVQNIKEKESLQRVKHPVCTKSVLEMNELINWRATSTAIVDRIECSCLT